MMAEGKQFTDVRHNILEQLHLRNKKENSSYCDVVRLTNKLYVSVNILEKENIKLKLQNAKLEDENTLLKDSCDTGSPRPSEKTLVLEKKVYQLQEELTELHRKKGEYAQQVIDLRNALDEKDKELACKISKLHDTEASLSASETNNKALQQKVSEMQLNNQLIKDEYDALLITYTSLEEKYQTLDKEHHDLINRWMALKARDADKLNAETERMQRLKQAQLQKELEEAAREPVTLDTSRTDNVGTPKLPPRRWSFNIGRVRQLIGVEDPPQATDTLKPISGKRMYSKIWSGWQHSRKPSTPSGSHGICRRSQRTKRFKGPICVDASLPNKMLFQFDAHDAEVNALAWAPSGKKVVTGGGDRKVKVWEIALGQANLVGVAPESNSSVMSVDFDTEETYILAASCDFASRVWSVNDLKIRHTLTGHSGKVMSAKFLGESSKAVSGSHDRTLKIWDLRRRACIRTIFAGSSCNDVVSCDLSGTTIVSGHFDKKIRFWDMRSESSANELLLQGKITSLDLSIDGFSLLCCVRDDTLKLLDFKMNQIVRTFSAEGFVIGCDWTRARFSPDGQYCVAGSQDGSIYIWSVASGKVERILKHHSSSVMVCAWDPNGSYLISCDKSKKVVVW